MNYRDAKDKDGNKIYYECYSPPLEEFLHDNGIYPLKDKRGKDVRYLHVQKRKWATIFMVTPQLSKALKEWTDNRDFI